MIKVSKGTFLSSWSKEEKNSGIALMLEPSPLFYSSEDEKLEKKKFGFFFRYLYPYKKYIFQYL